MPINEGVTIVTRAGVAPSKADFRMGVLRTHLYNYALARRARTEGRKAIFIMRGDDSDLARHTDTNLKQLYEILAYKVGLTIDIHPYNAEKKLGVSLHQSRRNDIYEGYLNKLLDLGLARAVDNTDAVALDMVAFADRFGTRMRLQDLVLKRGGVDVDLELMIKNQRDRNKPTYVPIRRADRSYLFHLCSPVDDYEFGVTHVLRGSDKLSIEACQEMVRIALDFPPVQYGHIPMLKPPVNQDGSTRLLELEKQGFSIRALVSYCLSSGFGDPDKVYAEIDTFSAGFSPDKIHKNDATFDPQKLANINKKLVRSSPTKEYQDELIEYFKMKTPALIKGLAAWPATQELWNFLFKLRLTYPEAANLVAKIVENPAYGDKPQRFVDQCKTLLVVCNGNITCKDDVLKTTQPLKVDDVYHLLRWCLTGDTKGQDPFEIARILEANGKLKERVDHFLNSN